jgi:hypothetical protein
VKFNPGGKVSFIEEVPDEKANGRLSEIYAEDLKNVGYVKNTNRVMSLRPEAIDAWNALVRTVRDHLRLRRYELVTFAAAKALGCRY